jgi:outer membrane receptor protein involved in Fe transport
MLQQKTRMRRVKPHFLRLTIVLITALMLYDVMPVEAKNITTKFPEEQLSARLKKICEQGDADILFDLKEVSTTRVALLRATDLTVEQALERSLSGTSFTWKKTTGTSYAVVKRTADRPQAERNKEKTGKGKLEGTVIDKGGLPVPGATIVIIGTQSGTTTDAKGFFKLEVPARTVAVDIRCISYQKMHISDVKITAGRVTPLNVVLQEASEQLSEVVVTATYNKASANGLYAKQKAMATMSDGISSDLIKKTGDNNVAQVLKRVSGVTIENGKYVTVRGLSERYNNVQLNGSSLPSTEPNRRNFSFDIIPTALIDNVTIAKTFTPDMSGEFIGGLVEVSTLSIPEKPLLSVSIGTGFNTNSTGKDFHSSKRLGGDYLFGNNRNWYGTDWKSDTFDDIFKHGLLNFDELTDAQKKTINTMDAKVPNNWGFRNYKGAPTQNYSITVGKPFDLGNNNKLGVIASLTYRHEENTEHLEKAFYINGYDSLLVGNRYKFITSTGAVANIGWERPGHKITWSNLFNNRFTNTSLERITAGENDNGSYSKSQYSNPLINRLWQTQLSGEHQLPLDMKFTWTADYSKLNRITPDDRLAVGGILKSYVKDPAALLTGKEVVGWSYPALPGMNNFDPALGFLMYSKLDENKKNIGGNLEYPFIVQGNKQKLKIGYLGTFRHSNFEQTYMHTQEITLCSPGGSTLSEAYSPDLYANGLLYLRKFTNAATGYSGKQQIHAAYLMGEFTFWKKLHLIGGARMESGRTKTATLFWNADKQEYKDSVFMNNKKDWLPAATVVYNITDNLNVRAAYSKTLARPDFRELSSVQYYNVDDRIMIYNLGQIRQTYTKNVDIRFEWYPQAGEVVSISGFYKKFKDPVELITKNSGTGALNFDTYTVNLNSAIVKGIEFNLRKSFGFIVPGSFFKDLYLTGNATLLKGNVEYVSDSKNTTRNRPLLGLVPYSVNAGLSYSGKYFGAAVNYGTTGRKLIESGTYEKYDEYEAPRNVLDLQLSAKLLNGRMEVKANGSDLLGEVYRVYRNCSNTERNVNEQDGLFADRTSLGMNYNEGDWITNQYKRGATYSFSVSYNF